MQSKFSDLEKFTGVRNAARYVSRHVILIESACHPIVRQEGNGDFFVCFKRVVVLGIEVFVRYVDVDRRCGVFCNFIKDFSLALFPVKRK